MEFDSIAEAVTGVVAEVSELPGDDLWIKRDADLFEELGLDSLLALEIVAMLERKYRIEVPEDRIVEVRTLSQAIDLVRESIEPAAEAAAK
jgi:acyl carrier protein